MTKSVWPCPGDRPPTAKWMLDWEHYYALLDNSQEVIQRRQEIARAYVSFGAYVPYEAAVWDG